MEYLDINKKTNEMLQELSVLLKQSIENNRERIEEIINTLEGYAKEYKSEFLDDVMYIIKNLYLMNKEGK